MSKTWKDLLLSSGLPLEYSVKKILEDLHIYSPDEYYYERLNEKGLPTYFSVDIHALKRLTDFDNDYQSQLELLIECKYRYNNVKWIFSPQSEGMFLSKWQAFNPLDTLSKDKIIDRDHLSNFCKNYQFYRKGIEILDNDSNPKSIEQGINQLKYAVINRIVDSLKLDITTGYRDSIHMILPVLVTTAELWGLKPDVTLDEVKLTNNPEDISEKKDIIFLYVPPDRELIKFTANHLSNRFTAREKAKLNEIYEDVEENNFEHEVSFIARENPSLYAIITYKSFKKEIKKIIDFLTNKKLYQTREALITEHKTTSRHDEIPF